VIYSNDHRPSHVHVIGKREAVFKFSCPRGPVTLWKNFGFNFAEVNSIQRWLVRILASLCEGWEEIHGDT